MDLVCQRSWPTLCNELSKHPLFQDLDLFVIGPFLGQHNVPYQQRELWLNLEERTMSQLRVRLFENSVIKRRRWISVGLFFETRNVIIDLFFIVLIQCELMPRGKLINNKQTKTSKHSPNFWLFAHVECPRQSRRVVGDIEGYRMGIVCDGKCPNNMESGAIVDYNHHSLKVVDWYKLAIIVIALEAKCTLNTFSRETNVPPEFWCDQEYSSAFQGAISNCHSKRCMRD